MTHHIKGLDGTFTIARNSHGLYKRRARSSQSGGRSVWIGSWDDGGCLPASITERDLFATFEKYGPLQKVALWRGGDLQEGDPHWLENVGSHAWALYEDRNHAQDAIENEHGQKIKGFKLRVLDLINPYRMSLPECGLREETIEQILQRTDLPKESGALGLELARPIVAELAS